MIKINLRGKDLERYSKRYNGMMVCSCGCVGGYFNIVDDLNWRIHRIFCKEKSIRSPKEINKEKLSR